MKAKVYGYCRVSTMKQSIERQIRIVEEQYPDAVIVTDNTTGRNFDRPGWMKLYKNLQPGDTVVFDEVSRMSRDADEGFQIYEELFQKGVNLIFIAEPHINTSVFREAGKKQIEVNLQSGSEPIDRFGNGMISLVNELLLDLAKEQMHIAFVFFSSDYLKSDFFDFNSRRTSNSLKEKQKRNAQILLECNGDIEKARKHPDWREIGQPKGAKLTTKKSVEAKKVILKRSKDFNGNLSDPEVMKLTGIARGTYYKYKRELKSEAK